MENPSHQTACVSGIEIHIFGADENSGAPVVFVTHGRMGQVSHVFGYCRELAEMGLIAIAVEQRNHGKRTVDGAANGNWSLHHAADMYGIFVGTALDVSLLIDAVPARLAIATDRVGMTGVSLGGHATLAAMAIDDRIQVGAPLIGSGDYRHLMVFRANENDCSLPEFEKYFPSALEAMVRRYDPIHHPKRFADRPLLMLNGADDRLVPAECNQRLEAALKPCYRHCERLKLSIFEGVGHATPAEMWNEAKEWLGRWLIQSPVK